MRASASFGSLSYAARALARSASRFFSRSDGSGAAFTSTAGVGCGTELTQAVRKNAQKAVLVRMGVGIITQRSRGDGLRLFPEYNASFTFPRYRDLPMDAQRLFLDQLPLIERVVHFICRRYALKGADADDFASTVKLQLIDHDYAILRQFQQRSSLGTYLKVVIQRMYLDQRVREWGKWRPAVRARQLGEPAILLDLLVNRDGQPA